MNNIHFFLIDKKLYCWRIDWLLRHCFTYKEVSFSFEDYHLNAYSWYFSSWLIVQKSLRTSYFLPKIFANLESFASSCDTYKQYTCNDLNLSMLLNPSLSLILFEKWGINYIRCVYIASLCRMQYIVAATKYLIKWIERKVFKMVDAKQTIIFLCKNIIAYFGCPKIFLRNNITHF